MATQTELNISEPIDSVETYKFDPIQGEPMLHWKGKRPFESTQYYPAQLKETYGEEVDGWRNKIYWGDNLQVMSHLLKTYRGQIALIYIDPPFDSKAEYKKKIQLRGQTVENDRSAFEEKQYTDIWTNDEYLQFMYERLILLRALLADNGAIYLHCDPTASHYIKVIMDEIFGNENFRNEIIWCYKSRPQSKRYFGWKHDCLLFYSKSNDYPFNWEAVVRPLSDETISKYRHVDENGRLYRLQGRGIVGSPIRSAKDVNPQWEIDRPDLVVRDYLDEKIGVAREDWWTDINIINQAAKEDLGYPTQKPIPLLARIIKASSNPGDLVFDCFMGSGTTQAVTMKLGRRFIGADINLGAVEITTKRLLGVAAEIEGSTAQEEINLQEEDTEDPQTFYTGFETYNVNHYDIFRNPVEAKDLLIEALEIQPLQSGGIYDGEKDGRMVKIMPINRIATRADLNELIAGFDYQAFVRRQEEHPTLPVEKLLLVCMGHEPDLAAALQNEVLHKLDIEVVDILRDKSKLEFKRESKAKIVRRNGLLIIEQFYPMNLLQKLSLMEESVDNWRELVESVKVDFNYDGAVMTPSVVDLPEGNEMVKGSYPIPEDAGTIQVKITDLLSESLEETLE